MKISPKIYWNWTIWVNVGEFGSIPVLLNLVGISSFLSDIRYDHLSSVDWPAQTPLPGSGRHSRSPRWWARSGICTQLPAPLFPRWREMDHLEGPLGPRCKWDFSHVLALITNELDPSVSVTNKWSEITVWMSLNEQVGCQHKKHTAEGDSIIDRIRLNILGLLSINEVLITDICIIHLHLIYLLFIVKLSSLELSQASGWTMQRMHVQSLYSFKASIIASVEYLIWWYMVLCVLYHSYMAAWELQTPTTKCLRKVTLFGSHLHLLFWTLYWHTTNIEKLQTEVIFFALMCFI